jgi:hypothetical protein
MLKSPAAYCLYTAITLCFNNGLSEPLSGLPLLPLCQATMSIHNEWRRAQGLPPLPSKSKRLPAQEEPRAPPSDQADPPAAGADTLDRVLAHLAVSDDDSNDSDPADEEGSTEDDAALADEALATAEGRIEAQDQPVLLQAQRESFGAPVDGVAGQHA